VGARAQPHRGSRPLLGASSHRRDIVAFSPKDTYLRLGARLPLPPGAAAWPGPGVSEWRRPAWHNSGPAGPWRRNPRMLLA
jgi:hypothetical protein